MSFPDPPIYTKYYTSDAVKNGTAPPPPPIPKKFKVFGEDYDLEAPYMPTLNALGITQVYEQCHTMEKYKTELKKINSSIMIAFIDLVNILTRDPLSEARIQQFETLKTLFINMHHLINECRVVQGRATLVSIQKEQNRQKESLIKTFGSAKRDAVILLREAITIREVFEKQEEDFKWEGEDYEPSDYDEEQEPMVIELISHRNPEEEAKIDAMPPPPEDYEKIIHNLKRKQIRRRAPKDSMVRIVDERDEKSTGEPHDNLSERDRTIQAALREALHLDPSQPDNIMEEDGT